MKLAICCSVEPAGCPAGLAREPPRTTAGAAADGETIYYVNGNGVGFRASWVQQAGVGVNLLCPLRDGRLFPLNTQVVTDIGLAILRRIITRHDGRVWAEGRVNEDATIFFA